MTEFKLFVYGSMSEGMVHYPKIADFVQNAQEAQIRGRCYRLKVGFPVVTDEAEDLIAGQLLTVAADSTLLLTLLDEFHGVKPQEPEKSLFFRREVNVQSADGIEKAWVYMANPRKISLGATVIEGGLWREKLATEPALTEKLTDRQKQYIQRLGASTGREIVPIDLALYRELMNLEMIVDKGRRLALSKLGHEVYRYLGR
ncbi:MAG: gamma-glutamylcyclotransferase [Bdellovibrionaceae bacterium]|nr:gamma-glutamylcyclotransferase [Pseudobdellovibrionaceae bacterium]